jgi:hypothetical protein
MKVVMREEKHYCDICNKDSTRYSLFDIALQLTERSDSNINGQRTIIMKEVCADCLELMGINPTNKTTHSAFGLNEYDNSGKSIIKLIERWFGR